MLMVQTKYGILEGVQEEGYAKFLGVPYAQPPVGALRWKRPQPPRQRRPRPAAGGRYQPMS